MDTSIKMPFGKYKGKTLLEIARINPSYIKWLAENNVVKIPDDILTIACNNTTVELDVEDLHSNWGCRD